MALTIYNIELETPYVGGGHRSIFLKTSSGGAFSKKWFFWPFFDQKNDSILTFLKKSFKIALKFKRYWKTKTTHPLFILEIDRNLSSKLKIDYKNLDRCPLKKINILKMDLKFLIIFF